jgi:hypothetical protein
MQHIAEPSTPRKSKTSRLVEPSTPSKPKKSKFAHLKFGIDYITVHEIKVKFVPKPPTDSDYVLLITDHRKKNQVFMFSTKLNPDTMPKIFQHGMQQAMEKNSQNEKCMTGDRMMYGGEYSEYASAVNMKLDSGLQPEDQELCDSTHVITSVMCEEFDKWLALVCIEENKMVFWNCTEGIPEINHILVIRRKDVGDAQADENESKDEFYIYENDDFDEDYNMTFI